METPLRIATRNVAVTEALMQDIRERTLKLEQFFPRITACRVTLEGPGGHHGRGRHQVRIVLTVPTTELIVSRQGDDDPILAVHKAFDAVTRQVEEYANRIRGFVKAKREPSVAAGVADEGA